MRRPPPLSAAAGFPLSGGLCLLASGVTLAWQTGHPIEALTMSGIHLLDQPWRMVTSILPHVGFFHLFFNVYWTWVFGTLLERELGHFKLALIVLVLAVGSSVAELAVFEGGVGLSGVGYGFFGMLWVMRRNPRFADVIDTPTIQTFVAWFFLCIVLTLFKVEPVANVAHGMGMALGALLGWILIAPKQLRPLALAALTGALTVIFLSATLLRPVVNFSRVASGEYVNAACAELEANRPREALRLLDVATSFRYEDGYGWYNKGVAYERLGDRDKALACYRLAVQLAPAEQKFQAALKESQNANRP